MSDNSAPQPESDLAENARERSEWAERQALNWLCEREANLEREAKEIGEMASSGMLTGDELEAARMAYERDERYILERLAILDGQPDNPGEPPPFDMDVY